MGNDHKSIGAYDFLIPAPQDGVGLSLVDTEYAQNTSTTQEPTTGWNTTAPAWKSGYYYWQRTHIVKTDGTESYTKAVCITGGTGQTGRGIKNIVEQYYISTSNSSLEGGSWSGTSSIPQEGQYVWTRSKITYTDGVVEYTDAVCVTGQEGKPFVGPALSDENVLFAEGSSTVQEAIISVEMLEGDSYAPIRMGVDGEGRTFLYVGTAYGHYSSIGAFRNAYGSGNIQSNKLYLVDETNADGYAMTCTWNSTDGEKTDEIKRTGIGYKIYGTTRLWISEGNKWVDMGETENVTNPTNGHYHVTFKKSGSSKTYVEETSQNTVLPCGTGTDGWFCSLLSSMAELSDGLMSWTYAVIGTRFTYKLKLLKPFDGRKSIPFRIGYKGKVYHRNINVTCAKRGNCGPALRGPQAWSDLPDGYAFQAGGEGDEYKDVVLYEGNYYSCAKNHYKQSSGSSSNHPYGTVDQTAKNWKLGDKTELVATNILLTTYALVKNLGVEAVEMKDANGNVVFLAKNGNVTCKSGIFENITVRGSSTFQGSIDGVTGSFKSLECKDDSGKVVGIITFGSDSESNGRFTIGGNILHQGADPNGNSYIFRASDFFCRGQFGARQRTTLVVCGTYGYYFPHGMPVTGGWTSAAAKGQYVAFSSKSSSSNETYYEVPLYGTSGDAAGMPVDTVLFRINSSTVYRYELVMLNTQRARLINVNNDYNNAVIYTNGNKYTVNGGETLSVQKINPDILLPAVSTTKLGAGIIPGNNRDNDW